MPGVYGRGKKPPGTRRPNRMQQLEAEVERLTQELGHARGQLARLEGTDCNTAAELMGAQEDNRLLREALVLIDEDGCTGADDCAGCGCPRIARSALEVK